MRIQPTRPSEQLKASVDHTKAAAAGTLINKEGREFSATLGPVDQSAAERETSAARNSMITYRLD